LIEPSTVADEIPRLHRSLSVLNKIPVEKEKKKSNEVDEIADLTKNVVKLFSSQSKKNDKTV
jgi:hypothetical protein